MTYRELNERANRFAEKLRALGVAPEMRVGICVERSLNTAVGLMGIFESGRLLFAARPDLSERNGCNMRRLQAVVTYNRLHGIFNSTFQI